MEWKEKLETIRDTLPEGEKEKNNNITTSDNVKSTEKEETYEERKKTYEEEKKVEMQEKRADDDDEDFQILVKLLDLQKGSKQYYRTRDLLYKARRRDVEFEVNRWISLCEKNPEIIRIRNKLIIQGYRSEAYNRWQAAQPEGMKFGTSSKEKRLQEAEEFAVKTGLPLKEIIEEYTKDG